MNYSVQLCLPITCLAYSGYAVRWLDWMRLQLPLLRNHVLRAPFEEGFEVVQRGIQDALDGFLTVEGNVRREDDVVAVQQHVGLHDLPQRLFGNGGAQQHALLLDVLLALDHIESGAGKDALIERPQERFGVHNRAAGGVDEQGTALHHAQPLAVDHVVGLRRGGDMERDDIGAAQERL